MVDDKKKIGITPLRKITFLIFGILALCILLLVYKKYIYTFMLVIICIYLSTIWYKLLVEEIVLYYAIRNNMECQKIIETLGKKAESAVYRLIKKKVVKKDGEVIILLKNDFKFSMTKR